MSLSDDVLRVIVNKCDDQTRFCLIFVSKHLTKINYDVDKAMTQMTKTRVKVEQLKLFNDRFGIYQSLGCLDGVDEIKWIVDTYGSYVLFEMPMIIADFIERKDKDAINHHLSVAKYTFDARDYGLLLRYISAVDDALFLDYLHDTGLIIYIVCLSQEMITSRNVVGLSWLLSHIKPNTYDIISNQIWLSFDIGYVKHFAQKIKNQNIRGWNDYFEENPKAIEQEFRNVVRSIHKIRNDIRNDNLVLDLEFYMILGKHTGSIRYADGARNEVLFVLATNDLMSDHLNPYNL